MAGKFLGAITVAAASGLTLLALASPASAHTPTSKAECVGDKTVVSVKLASYARSGNTIVVKDGEAELVNTSFGDNYEKSWTVPGDVAHTVTIAVKASDGDKNNYAKTLKTEACVKPTAPSSSTSASKPSTPATSESAPPSSAVVPPSVTDSSEPAPTTTTSPAGAGGGEGEATPPLASTGASPGWLLLSGLGLVGAGAVAMVVVRRKRAA
ncbi:MAG: LPXTG cell wall anchor domain-containing protein [Umezawaea sp.]